MQCDTYDGEDVDNAIVGLTSNMKQILDHLSSNVIPGIQANMTKYRDKITVTEQDRILAADIFDTLH